MSHSLRGDAQGRERLAGASQLGEEVQELHLYLSDQKAPLLVVEPLVRLLEQPPEFLAAEVGRWATRQPPVASVSDYLYHAARKILALGELNLVPQGFLEPRRRPLNRALLAWAPESERQELGASLELVPGSASAALGGPSLLYRPSSSSAEGGISPEAGLGREVRRLSFLLESLRPLATSGQDAADPRRSELTSQFVAEAAGRSVTADDLAGHLAPLRDVGLADTREMLRTLARSLAGWVLPHLEGRAPSAVAQQRLQAMERIVTLAPEPSEAGRRYREMVHTAVEQLEEGHLGRASQLFEVAERLANERRVAADVVADLRGRLHPALDEERLARLAERVDLRAQLRSVLAFFAPLQPRGLLGELEGEPRRERRYRLLALLEVHEQATRTTVWEQLTASLEDRTADPFFQMNLVYLLRVIPRPREAAVEEEVEAVMRTMGRRSPPPLVKQVVAYLAQTRHERAERALVTCLRVFESMLLEPGTASYSPADVELLLDRTCAALARYGTPRAWRALVDHGLKSEARLGSPFLRLAEAGRVDLSSSRDLVARIVAAVRAELPQGSLLSLVSRRDESKAAALVRALGGTPLPEVHELLQEIVQGRRTGVLRDAAVGALNALSRAGARPEASNLSGDLELFGLPTLLQTVAQSQLTGVLSLLDGEGRTRATLLFEQGQFRGGGCGIVAGEEAVYQLLEQPFPGTFAFVARPEVGSQPRCTTPQAVLPLLMEGVRRHDEFRRVAAIVPDAARLFSGSAPPSTPADEDPDLARLVWSQVGLGRTAQECENVIGLDSYRVRRLLAQWVEEGALRTEARGAA